jgi:hypothetical protein
MYIQHVAQSKVGSAVFHSTELSYGQFQAHSSVFMPAVQRDRHLFGHFLTGVTRKPVTLYKNWSIIYLAMLRFQNKVVLSRSPYRAHTIACT